MPWLASDIKRIYGDDLERTDLLLVHSNMNIWKGAQSRLGAKADGTCEREAVTARTKYTEFRIDVGVATGGHRSVVEGKTA